MPENRTLPRPAALAALALCLATPLHARPELCELAAHRAAAEFDVPQDLMRAIALAETGRTIGRASRPWPWTVNVAGAGRWFASVTEAKAHVEAVLATGVRNIDIGCFQLNHRWHGDAFASLDQMLDPETNARHAARFLAALYRETGDWTLAAGAYHSRTPHLAERYRNRVAALLTQPGPEIRGPAPRARNAFPLMRAGQPGSPGSLVPGAGTARPLLSAVPSRLIGG